MREYDFLDLQFASHERNRRKTADDEFMRLQDKVAIVTGSALGLGRAVAARFAREGATVVAADINEGEGAAVVDQLQRDGLKADFVRTDVSAEREVIRLMKTATEKFGRIDILYNNAAVLCSDREAFVHEISLEAWEYVLGVNLRGPFLCSKYAIPSMLNNGGGSIIHTGSPTGLIGCAPKLTAYSVSKGGIAGLTRVMAAAYGANNIRVNSIVPGTMDTPMNRYILNHEEVREEYRQAVPLKRLGKPEDIEGIAVFLASDESAYCTGGTYMCDGGLTAV
jgi:NAD(P)-dependent dehydrogenase (short-subunit alcohol dehydrogenase family)